MSEAPADPELERAVAEVVERARAEGAEAAAKAVADFIRAAQGLLRDSAEEIMNGVARGDGPQSRAASLLEAKANGMGAVLEFLGNRGEAGGS